MQNATDGFLPCFVLEEATFTPKIGDVVAYQYRYNQTVVHRIKAQCEDTSDTLILKDGNETRYFGERISGFTIQGDNVPFEDPYCVPSWAIKTKVKMTLCLADYIK